MFSSPDISRDVEVIPFILTDLKADGMGFYALIAKHAYGTSNQSGLLSLVYRESPTDLFLNSLIEDLLGHSWKVSGPMFERDSVLGR